MAELTGTLKGDQIIDLCNRTHLYEDITFNTPIRTIAQNGQDFNLIYSDHPEVGPLKIDMATTGNNCITEVGALTATYPRFGIKQYIKEEDPNHPRYGMIKTINGVLQSFRNPRLGTSNKLGIKTRPGTAPDVNASHKTLAGNKFGSIKLVPEGLLTLNLSVKHSGEGEEFGVIQAVSVQIESDKPEAIQGAAGVDHMNRVTIGEITGRDAVMVSGISGTIGEVNLSTFSGIADFNHVRLEAGVVNSSGIDLTNSTLLGTELIATTTGAIIPTDGPRIVRTSSPNPAGGPPIITETFPDGLSLSTPVPFLRASKCVLVSTPIKTHDLQLFGSGIYEPFNYEVEFVQQAACKDYGFMAGSIKATDPNYLKTTKTVGGTKQRRTIDSSFAGPTLSTECFRFGTQVEGITEFIHRGLSIGDNPSTIESSVTIEDMPPFNGAIHGTAQDYFKIQSMPRSITITSNGTIDVLASGYGNGGHEPPTHPEPSIYRPIHIKGTLTAPRINAFDCINYGTIIATDIVKMNRAVNYGTIKAAGFSVGSGSRLINSGTMQYLDGTEYPYTNPPGL